MALDDDPLLYQPIPGYGPFGDAGGATDSSAAPAAQPAPSPAAAAPAPPAIPALAPLPAPAPATSTAAASRRAGASIVFAGVGVGTGALLGGLWGAGSGLFFSGAAINALRARSLWASDFADDRKEAVKTTVMAIVGLGVAGYLGYRAHERRRD